MEKNKWKQWIYWFTLGIAIVAVYKTLDSFTAIADWFKGLFDILMPFICAVLVAYIFYIPARRLEGLYKKATVNIIKNHARGFSVLSIYVIALILIVTIIKFVWPSIANSIVELINSLPGYYENALKFVNELPADSMLSKVDLKGIITNLQNIDFSTMLNLESIPNMAAKSVMGATNIVFNFFVTIIVSIYILLERRQILEFMKNTANAMFPKKTYKKIGEYFRKTNEIFYKFISSQVLDAIVVGILMSITLSIMQVKYGVLLGMMIGLFNVIPFFGAIIGVAIAVIITMFTGGFTKAIIMTIIVIILQQIDANIINPKIVGSSLKLSPILIIFAVTVGGAYFGVLGMFLSVPVIAMIKILVLDYIEYKNAINDKNEK